VLVAQVHLCVWFEGVAFKVDRAGDGPHVDAFYLGGVGEAEVTEASIGGTVFFPGPHCFGVLFGLHGDTFFGGCYPEVEFVVTHLSPSSCC